MDGKRLGNILILAAFMGVMLVSQGRAQGREVSHDREDESSEDAQTHGGAEIREDTDELAFEEYWETLPERQPRVTMKYGEEIFPAKYSDEVIEAEYTDDLSLLEEMDWTDHFYACQDGRVYYRQYHEEISGVDGLGSAHPVTDGEKEMVCVDQEGVRKELFKDNGWGDFYLIGDRFYMTECRSDALEQKYRIYSVDMEGKNRIDYGFGEIKAVDETGNILFLEMQEGGYGLVSEIRVLDCVSGDYRSLGPLLKGDGWNEGEEFRQWSFEAYQDGWMYLSCLWWNGPESARNTDLYAVSPEGIWQKVITLTSDETTYIKSIIQLEVLEDRLFFTYGGYGGTAQFYQGGSIISVRRDGTDYRAIESIVTDKPASEDNFYLRQDAGRTLVYYAADYYTAGSPEGDGDKRYYMTVWDVDTGTLYPSTFPGYPVCNRRKGIYLDTKNDVCALPDRSGRIVRVVQCLEDYLEIPEGEEGKMSFSRPEHVFFADGYLYFTAEYDFDSEEYKKGRETAYYRLKLGEDQAGIVHFTVNREREKKYWREYWKTQVTVEMDGQSALSGYCDEVIGTVYTEDLSLLEQSDRMSHQYAYRDGRVYFRRYHEDSFEESSYTEENYSYLPIDGAEKEMVSIDRKGVQTTLFTDKGQGDFYLIGDRFYMTDSEVYSVDLKGGGRTDYGRGEILAADMTGHFLILELWEDGHDWRRPDYCVLDCDTGVCTSLLSEEYHAEDKEDGVWRFEAYQDGWVYVSFFRGRVENSKSSETTLYAVSVEGEWNEVITLTSDNAYYSETVVRLQVLEDRLFFLFGGYSGSGQVYQGGRIVTVKRDGTDYRSVEQSGNDFLPADCFYLRQDGEKIWVYYPDFYHITEQAADAEEETYAVTVWDIDTGMRYPSDMPGPAVTKTYQNDLFIDGEDSNDVMALSGRTGRIVRAAGDLDACIESISAEKYEEDASLRFEDLYYRDGYLYFKAEYSRWGGWEQGGWLRLGTERYRLKIGEDKAELLYYY